MNSACKRASRIIAIVLLLLMTTSTMFNEGTQVLMAAETAVRLENCVLEFDWSKFDVGIGDSLDADDFEVGFVKTEGFSSRVSIQGPIKRTLDGYDQFDELGECSVYGQGSYEITMILSLEDGYYIDGQTSIPVNDPTVVGGVAQPWEVSDGKATKVMLTMQLGDGYDMIKRVEQAINNSITQAGNEALIKPKPNKMKYGSLSIETFMEAFAEFWSDHRYFFISKGVFEPHEKGDEIHPFASGTKDYIEEGQCLHIFDRSSKGVYVDIHKINDKSKTQEIADKLAEWEDFQAYDNITLVYNDEYIIYIVIPAIYNYASGMNTEVAKLYFDAYYDAATAKEPGNECVANIQEKSELEGKVALTEEEKTSIAKGELLEVVLTFSESGKNATTEEQKAIENALSGMKLGTFLEIDLTKKIGAVETEISETNECVKITIDLSKDLINEFPGITRTYSVMRVHDGVVETLDTSHNEIKNTLTFETDRFSTYAIVYQDEINTMAYIIGGVAVLGILLMVVIILGVIRKK